MFHDAGMNPAFTEALALTAARWIPVSLFSPVCGTLPMPLRAGAGVVAAVWLSTTGGPASATASPFILQLLYEVALGLIIAVSVRLVFEGVWAAGALIDASLFSRRGTPADPSHPGPLRALAVLASLAVVASAGGLRLLCAGALSLHESLPLGADPLNGATFAQTLSLAGSVFATALMLAGPVLVLVLLIDISTALLTKLAPYLDAASIRTPLAALGALLVVSAGGVWIMDAAMTRASQGFSKIAAPPPLAETQGSP